MKSQIRPALVVFGLLTLVTGVAYPLLVTLIGQGLFAHQANGSLSRDADGKAIGSELIGQPFDAPHYFWGRPPFPNNAAASTGSNQGPTNPDLSKSIGDRVEALRKAHPDQAGAVPADLVTASASGLDPHISPGAAAFQMARVASARGVHVDEIRHLVSAHTETRALGVLGEPRVNVLMLNRDLDTKFPVRGSTP
jgi:K+-transporting ATPase ATPase C chain